MVRYEGEKSNGIFNLHVLMRSRRGSMARCEMFPVQMTYRYNLWVLPRPWQPNHHFTVAIFPSLLCVVWGRFTNTSAIHQTQFSSFLTKSFHLLQSGFFHFVCFWCCRCASQIALLSPSKASQPLPLPLHNLPSLSLSFPTNSLSTTL
jgi:hypothetical protein